MAVNEKPSYFFTSLNEKMNCWICNVLYETKIKNLDFIPSEECVEPRFFTKEEALKEKLFSNVAEFIKIYNPDNHKP